RPGALRRKLRAGGPSQDRDTPGSAADVAFRRTASGQQDKGGRRGLRLGTWRGPASDRETPVRSASFSFATAEYLPAGQRRGGKHQGRRRPGGAAGAGER